MRVNHNQMAGATIIARSNAASIIMASPAGASKLGFASSPESRRIYAAAAVLESKLRAANAEGATKIIISK
jgi:hypothetical protein